MKLSAGDIRELSLIKHYRIIRKWACKNNNLLDADLELLIYLDCMDFFSKQDYKMGVYSYSWDNKRWNKLLKNDWIIVWRNRNRTTQKYNLYKTSVKAKQLITRIYKIMLGDENINVGKANKIINSKTYTNKVMTKAIYNINNDKSR
tara:strand:+ start:1239 stop:1679 length:441 start_codon:yes stop_codon:yes gene_type:complete